MVKPKTYRGIDYEWKQRLRTASRQKSVRIVAENSNGARGGPVIGSELSIVPNAVNVASFGHVPLVQIHNPIRIERELRDETKESSRCSR